MSIQADIVGYDNQGKLTLVVEVKNKLGTDGGMGG
jgi:RecB family endonuclease NucS